MKAIFISSLNSAESFIRLKNKYNFTFVVTDKISVNDFFNYNQINCILLSKYIDEKNIIICSKKSILNLMIYYTN